MPLDLGSQALVKQSKVPRDVQNKESQPELGLEHMATQKAHIEDCKYCHSETKNARDHSVLDRATLLTKSRCIAVVQLKHGTSATGTMCSALCKNKALA